MVGLSWQSLWAYPYLFPVHPVAIRPQPAPGVAPGKLPLFYSGRRQIPRIVNDGAGYYYTPLKSFNYRVDYIIDTIGYA